MTGLLIETRGPLATLTLNRPEIHNAFDEKLIAELSDFFARAAKDRVLRAVVLKGAGRHFCAGGDINWMRRAASYTKAENLRDAGRLVAMLRAVDECPVPVLARAHGACFGGGLGILAAADVAVCSQDAQMSFSECRLGIIPAVVSSFVIPKIGPANARRYFLTAETFGADAALRMGLVHEVCPEAELDARIGEILGWLFKAGPSAVREAKALIRKIAVLNPERRFGFAAAALARVRAAPEAKEGLAAFLEKRAPSWVR